MRPRRRIVTAAVSAACAVALAACGQQVVAKVVANDSVHGGLAGVFSSPTTRFVVTAQDLPGAAALADGSFAVVITVTKATGASGTNASSANAVAGLAGDLLNEGSMEISVLHESSDLADIVAVDGADYLRVNLKDIASLAGKATEFTAISSAVSKMAAAPNLGYLDDVVSGKWVGVSKATLQEIAQKYGKDLSGSSSKAISRLPASVVPSSMANLEKLLQNPAKVKQLGLTVSSSFMQSVKMWLSVHQNGPGEYSLTLPVRSFVGTLADKLVQPLEAAMGGAPAVSKAQLAQGVARIPSDLSLHADVWIAGGSLTKIQAFIPDTSAYLMIGVSHPATPVAAPGGATMLTMANITALSSLSSLMGGSVSSSASAL